MLETQPERITLGDWQAAQGSIFTHLIEQELAPYLEGTDALTMEFLLGSLYSQRKVRPFFEKLSAQEVGRYIHQIYSSRWTQDFDLFQKFIELEGEAVAKGSTTRTTDTNQVNKTSGFDGSELVDDTGANITGSDASTNNQTNLTQAGLLAKASAARKRQFHERLCEDIARFITLAIY